MGLKNKKSDMTPFDMRQKPCRQCAALLPLVWGASFFATRRFRLKIDKSAIKELKPPYLVISTHQGFSDYYIAPLALFPHRANYVSDMEGFAAFGKTLYRKIGCIGKRRYVADVNVMTNIRHVLNKNKDILVLFPESRHSNVGTTSLIPENIGRLCKTLGVSVVTLSVRGSYLANPFWNETLTRKVPMYAVLDKICTAEQLREISADRLQSMITDKLTYNEYDWQLNNHIAISGMHLADGLHKPLYQCIECGGEFTMSDSGNRLFCNSCGASWDYSEYGELLCGERHLRIPDWYERERKNVIDEIEREEYSASFEVNVEALPNEKGFVPLGNAILQHGKDGFRLDFPSQTLFFPSRSMESVQTEYDYRGKGMCVVLSTKDCCYYAYSDDRTFNPTKLQFAAEYFHAQILKEHRNSHAASTYSSEQE